MVRFTLVHDGDLTDYFRLYRETQGFDVNSAGRVLSGGITQMGITCTESIRRASDDAKHALRSHNKYHKTDLEFVRYVKCNTQAVGGTMYYITFEARSPSLNQTNIYQAKVYTAFSGRKKVIIFRIKPSGPTPPKGAFLRFMHDLRKLPRLSQLRHRQKVMMSLASRAWRPMSTEAKLRYYNTRRVKYEDIAQFLSAKMRKFCDVCSQFDL